MKSATEMLIRLMNLRPTGAVDVCRTSDGFYMGRAEGDMGYNMFLGKPVPIHYGPGLEMTRAYWASLTPGDQAAVSNRAACPVDGSPIPLADFGVEEVK